MKKIYSTKKSVVQHTYLYHKNPLYKTKNLLLFLMIFVFSNVDAQLDELELGAENILQYFVDGGDTIFIDDSGVESEIMHLSDPIPYNIEVKLSSAVAEIESGLFGLNVAGMFFNDKQPEDSYGDDQWEMMSDLKPNTIRFPSGGSSTFMHLLHHPTLDTDEDGENDLSQGYGYVIEEIVSYFDYTDGEWDAISLASILADNDEDAAIIAWGDEVTGWIGNTKLAGEFYGYLKKYRNQILLPANTRYVDHLKKLIKKIEIDNPELRVQVILCLNIASETAEDGKEIVKYLRLHDPSNDIYGVDVYGVEMGNECYNTFYQEAMGFTTFDNYYGYLLGEAVPGFDVDAVLRPEMEGEGHEFLKTFKNDMIFNVKVAVVGFDNPDPDDNSYQLRGAGGLDELPTLVPPDWNSQIPNHYNELISVEGTLFSRMAFDAVVLHPYYGIDNYKHEIVDLNLLSDSYTCPPWDYSEYDSRLQPAFDLMTTKFITLMRSGYRESFERWSIDLGFHAGVNPTKELWTTEWNYKDAGNILATDLNRMEAFSNTYLQGALVFEWNLKNIKINFDPMFRGGFMPFSTYHNFGGGGNSEMLSFANRIELVHYNLDPEPWMTADFCDPDYWSGGSNPNHRAYYLKHTPFFAQELVSDIYSLNLLYMKTNFKVPLAVVSDNIQPTVFIDPLKQYIYIYYSNFRGHKQNYILNPTSMLPLFSGAVDIEFDVPLVKCLEANYPYSTAGKGAIYELNTCYDDDGAPDNCTDNSLTNAHPIDLKFTQIIPAEDPSCSVGVPADKCITVREYSFGYIKVGITPKYEDKLSQVNEGQSIDLFPNPASNRIYIGIRNIKGNNTDKMFVTLFSIEGKLVAKYEINNYEEIQIESLASGCYTIVVSSLESSQLFRSTFIKM